MNYMPYTIYYTYIYIYTYISNTIYQLARKNDDTLLSERLAGSLILCPNCQSPFKGSFKGDIGTYKVYTRLYWQYFGVHISHWSLSKPIGRNRPKSSLMV